jgi:hypothetical protein
MELPRDLVAELEETLRLAAGQLRHRDITGPVEPAEARRLVYREHLASLLSEYAERLRPLLQ